MNLVINEMGSILQMFSFFVIIKHIHFIIILSEKCLANYANVNRCCPWEQQQYLQHASKLYHVNKTKTRMHTKLILSSVFFPHNTEFINCK